MKNKLLLYKYKTITIEQLHLMSGSMEYIVFFDLINNYVKQNLLEPVRASGFNGRNPALYNKYKINKIQNDYSDVLDDIKRLHPKFDHGKYSIHPEMYIKNKKEIDMLSRFLWEKEELLNNPMTINERSFQIWSKEKLLKTGSKINTIMQFNNMDLSLLNCFETPEPFFDYVFSNEKNMNVLIIENKDTWFSLRKIMRDDKLNFFYRPYNVLLYGEGKKIIRKEGRLSEYDRMLEGINNTYYYFGDLDYEGVDIYQSLLKYNKGLNIKLCTEFYELMIRESKYYELPKSKDEQKKVDIKDVLTNFDYENAKTIEAILNSGLYIPQEILNYPLLKSVMKNMEE